ncbi:CbiQ family ECF transporter T component (plasmid) [Rhizobium sp. 32-5/1]|uniref:CbiQ family ECF transporter T component n=1 Tax=Rhizobium sp. 32-5/1 TaxID=3019602 RepID=UPI00240E8A92|nr:CbiQ family ECF transporter T component [Rhizobium sp. 32-5/1]WEZ85925.1 CbiQ family ECF transporter T component [Rhizobium sp. 32-5/1]
MGLNAEISDIAMVMFRIIWLLLDCLEAGQRSLGARLGFAGKRRMLRSSGLLLASLLPRVLGRAKRMEAGLAARGYTGRLNFISVETPASRARLLAIGTVLCGMFFFMRWLG